MTTTEMTARSAMIPSPLCVAPEASVVDAARVMAQGQVGALPVVSDGRLVGMVTDRDLVVSILAEGLDGRQILVSDVCADEPASVTPDMPLGRVRRLMAEKLLKCVPVVEDGRVVGIVAQADVARQEPPAETGELAQEMWRQPVGRG